MAQCIACSDRAVQRHHIVYQQEVRLHASEWRERGSDRKSVEAAQKKLLLDERNLVPVCKRCHERHHARFHPLHLTILPDSVFEFAVELMGAGPAYEYLNRRYFGSDARLNVLLGEQAA